MGGMWGGAAEMLGGGGTIGMQWVQPLSAAAHFPHPLPQATGWTKEAGVGAPGRLGEGLEGKQP